MAKHYAEFNMLHPFREGNGRTQRVLFDYLAAINGYYIAWGNISPSDWIEANVYGVIQDYTYLYRIFSAITYEHA
ncbi:Fic family protein [Dickeya oryzae]|uniref:protein adenylyltransferase n=1 Tax=Dickeya oryzae TaxID=1240404 RepID=A0AB39IRU3_9GAMM